MDSLQFMDNPLQVFFAIISHGGMMCGFGVFFSFGFFLHPISVLFNKSPVSGNFPTMKTSSSGLD